MSNMAQKKLTTKQRIGLIKYRFLMWLIELLRRFTKHDLYIVSEQLHTRNTDPLDSWAFFCWLQKQNIPSCYIVHSDDNFYLKEIKGKGLKDIVVLDGNRGRTQIVEHIKIWKRARAFVTEWNIEIPFLNNWFQQLPDMQYVMLQHGIYGTSFDSLQADRLSFFNSINVSSEREQAFLDRQIPTEQRGRCIIGGLPRYEGLQNYAEANAQEKTLFIMLTWRNREGMTFDDLKKTEYWKGITQLLSNENINRLSQQNVKVVFALHHSLLRIVSDIQFHPNVKIASAKEIRYWIQHAHGLLTDFSSLSFDFLFLGKPVIYWIPDLNDSTLNPDDMGYGSKVLSAIENRKQFFNTADSLDEALDMIEYYAQHNFELEAEKQSLANTWFAHRSDISRYVYEGIENRIKSRQ